MSKSHTSSGIRVGSTDDMACHPYVYTTSAIARGGWYFDNESKYFRYITKKSHIDVAGKGLAGFHDPTLHVFAPSLSYIMNNENADVLRHLTDCMFSGCGIPELNDEGLKNLKEVMTALLIENLGDVIQMLGNTNILVRYIVRNAEEIGISSP